MEFPKRVIKQGEADRAVVTFLQQTLAKKGYGPFTAGVFDAAMTSVTMLFQAQNVDADGHALVVDGTIGRYTWGALVEMPPVVPSSAPSTLMLQALGIAGSQVGQMEVPLGSNRGPMVDAYLKATGVPLNGANSDERAWCMAFVYWAFATAAKSLSGPNPVPRTAGCVDHWARAGALANVVRIRAAEAYADPALIKPGLVFVLDFGHGKGHTGFVERLMPGGRLATVEGNTNLDGSRSGLGVFRLERRKLSDSTLLGFVDYSAF